MASHQLAIAKAALTAALLRPDPTATTRNEIERFHSLLGEVVTRCSPINVQKSKNWVVSNIIESNQRCSALGKYLAAFSSSIASSSKTNAGTKQTSARRKRLHILYVLNDILHHAQRHGLHQVAAQLQPYLEALFTNAASFENAPKQQRKLLDLLELWEERQFYKKGEVAKLQDAVLTAVTGQNGEKISENVSQPSAKPAQDVPFIMPSFHGDPTMPWYDLPAGTLMPHIVPNSAKPINPKNVKPLQFVQAPADERLIRAVKDLLYEVDNLDDESKQTTWDIDELGQLILPEEELDDEAGESYYGWSKAFCKKMRARQHGKAHPISRSRSQSSSREDTGLKRRRYSDDSDGEARGRSFSRPQFGQHGGGNSHDEQDRRDFPRETSYSRSRSGERDYRPSYHDSRERDQSAANSKRSKSPGRPQFQSQQPESRPSQLPANFAFPIPIPPGFIPPPNQFPLPGGIPVPPPPPPNYSGAWPPAFPTPGAFANVGGNQALGMWPNMIPPPPPPPPSAPHQNQQWVPPPPTRDSGGSGRGWNQVGSRGDHQYRGGFRGGRGGR